MDLNGDARSGSAWQGLWVCVSVYLDLLQLTHSVWTELLLVLKRAVRPPTHKVIAFIRPASQCGTVLYGLSWECGSSRIFDYGRQRCAYMDHYLCVKYPYMHVRKYLKQIVSRY